MQNSKVSNHNSCWNCSKSESKSYNGPILSFKSSKPNECKITAVFKDNDENEVKEDVNIYQHGDAKECLILPYKQVMDLGDLYNYLDLQ
jgi:hypothetical protein